METEVKLNRRKRR